MKHRFSLLFFFCTQFWLTGVAFSQSQSFLYSLSQPDSTPVHLDTNKPQIILIKRSGSFNGSTMCNSHFDSLIALDTALYDTGIKSIEVVGASNMILQKQPIKPGSSTVSFSAIVIDSMNDGNICLVATDMATPVSNSSDTICIDYCTIRDSLAPDILISPDPKVSSTSRFVTVRDNRQWDRKLSCITVSKIQNVTFPSLPSCDWFEPLSTYSFIVTTIDTTKPSGFCIQARDFAGNWSDTICVTMGINAYVSSELFDKLVISPNPASEEIHLSFINESSYKMSSLSIFDSRGSIIRSKTMAIPGTLNLRGISKGEYTLLIEINGTTITKKFIVK